MVMQHIACRRKTARRWSSQGMWFFINNQEKLKEVKNQATNQNHWVDSYDEENLNQETLNEYANFQRGTSNERLCGTNQTKMW